MMIKQKLILIFGISMIVPAVSMASGIGVHRWGSTPSHINPPPTHRRVCNLEGVWKENPYSKAWGEKRLKVISKNGPSQVRYSVHEFGIRSEVHEVVAYNANNQTVQVFTYARPDIFFYAYGKVSLDCRHISLFERYSDFATRKSGLSFVQR